MTFVEYFKAVTNITTPLNDAISLGAGGGQLELDLVKQRVVQRIVGYDLSRTRVHMARNAVPPHLSTRVRYEVQDMESFMPPFQVDLVVLKMAFHHIQNLEAVSQHLHKILKPNGLIYFDEFVGPARWQFLQSDIDVCNRLLQVLDANFSKNVRSGRTKRCGRPSMQAMLDNDPSEAARSDELIPALVRAGFRQVVSRTYGGSIFAWLFSQIMGNFERHPDAVRLIMEFERILEDKKLSAPHHVFAIFEKI